MTATPFNLEALHLALAGEPAIVFAYLFGSTVSGATSALSDIDVAIHPDRRLSLDERLGIIQRLIKKTGWENLDVTFLDRLENLYLLNHIITSGVLLLDCDRHRRELFEVRAQHRLFDFQYQRKLYLGE
ncbi:MAG: nucleotidyltransferase domain-containing protein [candidate division KSB1 bacterium]|nr:nucleotidyltransferase domain-containing protein [candidate division KSB1 bacterium]MDZ7276405.1 nucleotidyltransferase domain-containing protein [candidate division KSB1 bacterium]MDZ7288076.1 nucleotidyltransferase domain-containing protein [candidate division KSB1 bacterium]MDZ7300176.1 nucleotidyltransferase domain-containing protein [candidate division KSB1 bacterium]MDZ7305748.1 nucleotidyltransferase domain-containing protein [candidate division KSB1 bacterium]